MSKCALYVGNGFCQALCNVRCNGYNNKCSFYKSKTQFIEERDNAIKRCRKLNLCKRCTYRMGIKCKLSTELEDVSIGKMMEMSE